MSLKNNKYSIRFTDSQMEKLRKRALDNDMNLAEYIRYFLFAIRLTDIPIEKKQSKKQIQKKLINSPKAQVLVELKSIFEKGLELIEVSEEMKDEVKNNRKLPPAKLLDDLKKTMDEAGGRVPCSSPPTHPPHLKPPKL